MSKLTMDTDKIAEIIKTKIDEDLSCRGSVKFIAIASLKGLAIKLADHFKKEAYNKPNQKKVVIHKEYDVTDVGSNNEAIEEIKKFVEIEHSDLQVVENFNSKQFLKKAGVE